MIPATLSIITDMVGFATLATVDISFYKAYAYFGMFGMLTLPAPMPNMCVWSTCCWRPSRGSGRACPTCVSRPWPI